MTQDMKLCFQSQQSYYEKDFDPFLKEALIGFQEKEPEWDAIIGKQDMEKHGRSRTMKLKDS